MPFVASEGMVTSVANPTPTYLALRPYGVTSYDGMIQSYETLYAKQPNVRTVVSFIGRNMAQLKTKLYERVSDTERQYRRDHGLDRLMRFPNPRMSRYSFRRAMFEDLGIFDNAIAVKVKVNAPGATGLALVRIPPQFVQPVGDNWLFPERYRILAQMGPFYSANMGQPELPADQVVHLRGYNPTEPRWGLSPIETLRRILSEDIAAGEFREQLWSSGARASGYIERPLDAPAWSEAARTRFEEGLRSAYAGNGPDAGATPVLEDGMTWNKAVFDPAELEYLGARQLTRAECAAAYHVDATLVGMAQNVGGAPDSARASLLADAFAPLCQFHDEEMALQLLPDFEAGPDAFDRFYLETDLDEKLRGDFLTEAEATSRAVGGPWLLRNEARARRNLPPIEGGDEVITPLNVTTGGRANPADTAPGTPGLGQAALGPVGVKADGPAGDFAAPDGLAAYAGAHVGESVRFLDRVRASVLSRLGAGKSLDEAFPTRWDDELVGLLAGMALAMAPDAAEPIADRFAGDFDPDELAYVVLAESKREAAAWCGQIRADLADGELPVDVFGVAGERWTAATVDRTYRYANLARATAGWSAGAPVKVWVAAGSCGHGELDGATVPASKAFPDGSFFPQDHAPVAGCRCLVDFPGSVV